MIHYRTGDLFRYGELPGIIAHIVNDKNVWGGGFTAALSREFPEAERAYRNVAQSLRGLVVGETHFVLVAPKLYVANMCAQTLSKKVPLDYGALDNCLKAVTKFSWDFADPELARVRAPLIGTGLAGGRWSLIEPLLRGRETHICWNVFARSGQDLPDNCSFDPFAFNDINRCVCAQKKGTGNERLGR